MPSPAIEMEEIACSVCGATDRTVEASGRDYIYAGSDCEFSHVACRTCGHIYLNPRPLVSAISTMYPSNYGTFARKFRGATNPLALIKDKVNMHRFRAVASDLPRGAAVLDVGCGDGALLLAIKRARPDIEAHGLDWHFPAATRRELEVAGIRLTEDPLEQANLPEAAFDLILMNQLIEHLWDPAAGLRAARKALKFGGQLSIETPNTDGYDRRLFRKKTWGGYYFPRHLNLYNKPRLSRVAEACELEIISQKDLPAPMIWCYSLQACVSDALGQQTVARHLFNPRNIPLLAAFAMLDVVAIAIGLTSSNQQMVVRRPSG